MQRIISILRSTRTDRIRVPLEVISEARETHPHVAIEHVGAICRAYRKSISDVEKIIADMP